MPLDDFELHKVKPLIASIQTICLCHLLPGPGLNWTMYPGSSDTVLVGICDIGSPDFLGDCSNQMNRI